jgi:hypothetical protein
MLSSAIHSASDLDVPADCRWRAGGLRERSVRPAVADATKRVRGYFQD